jgi:hypothetical protein
MNTRLASLLVFIGITSFLVSCEFNPRENIKFCGPDNNAALRRALSDISKDYGFTLKDRSREVVQSLAIIGSEKSPTFPATPVHLVIKNDNGDIISATNVSYEVNVLSVYFDRDGSSSEMQLVKRLKQTFSQFGYIEVQTESECREHLQDRVKK